jgi:hypothetical protein
MSNMRQDPTSAVRWQQTAILVGTALFLLALAGSAILDPRLRLLHALQALIYAAILLLTRRNSPWGFGIGTIVPAAWNCMNLFLTHLMQTGTEQLWSLLRTGHTSQPVPIMVAVGGFGHFILIFACLAGFLRLRPGLHQWLRFIAGGVLAMAYLALIVRLTIGHGV